MTTLPTNPTELVLVAPKRFGVQRFLNELGPGLITGAADDDPSGISTYSVAGASFGYATLLLSDAQIALTLVESAELTSDDTVRTRHIEEAQKRVLMIMLRRPNLSVDEVKFKALYTHMRLLRNRLVRLGVISER